MTPGRALLLAVPALLTLHNLEELLAAPRFIPVVAARLAAIGFALSLPPALTPRAFAVAVTVATVVPWIIAVAAVAGRRTALYLLLVVQATMLVNVVPHLVSALIRGGYAPGVVTAIAINLPFSVYLLGRAWRERWIGRRAWGMLLPLALVVHGPVLFGLLMASAWIAGAF